jgi:WD40 repeat protein
VAFSPDGERLISAEGGSIKVWDAGSGKQLLVLEHEQGINSAVFTPDGTRLLTASGEVLVWDATNGQKLKAFKAFKGSTGKVAISRDGKVILGVNFDQSVELWDLESGRHQVSLDIRGGAYLAMFAPDGQQIVTVSRDGAIRFWPVDPLAAAVKRKSRDLTAEERQRYSITEVAK